MCIRDRLSSKHAINTSNITFRSTTGIVRVCAVELLEQFKFMYQASQKRCTKYFLCACVCDFLPLSLPFKTFITLTKLQPQSVR